LASQNGLLGVRAGPDCERGPLVREPNRAPAISLPRRLSADDELDLDRAAEPAVSGVTQVDPDPPAAGFGRRDDGDRRDRRLPGHKRVRQWRDDVRFQPSCGRLVADLIREVNVRRPVEAPWPPLVALVAQAEQQTALLSG